MSAGGGEVRCRPGREGKMSAGKRRSDVGRGRGGQIGL